MKTVKYRDIEGYPGYRVGDDGSVWSCRKRSWGGGLGETWRPLSAVTNRSGHLRCGLHDGLGDRERIFVHVLVLTTFVGPRPDGMECCHNNGNPADNRLSNLRWDSRKNNHADRDRHGTTARGVKHGRAKLAEADVIEIRNLRGTMSQTTIGAMFGVSKATVSQILRGKKWTHLLAN